MNFMHQLLNFIATVVSWYGFVDSDSSIYFLKFTFVHGSLDSNLWSKNPSFGIVV